MKNRSLRILGAASVAAASSSVFSTALRPLNDYLIAKFDMIAGGFLMISIMSILAMAIGAYWLTRAQTVVSGRDLLISAAVFSLIHWIPTRVIPVLLFSTQAVSQDTRMLYVADLASVAFFFVPGALAGLLVLRLVPDTLKRGGLRGDDGRFLLLLGAASVAVSSYFIVYYGMWPLGPWVDQMLGKNLLWLGDIVKMSVVSALAVPAGVYWLIRARGGTTGSDVLASVAIFALIQWFPVLILQVEFLQYGGAFALTDVMTLAAYLGGPMVPGAIAGLVALRFIPSRLATYG